MTHRILAQGKNSRTFLCIPAYLRDKFGLKKGSIVDVTDTEGKIVITPIMENDKE
ncbi:looped-hinge helix DNA binding domain, AbrB family [Methanomethylovorans hollandica DSM 15978]|uniref:Looped-hinge helix DNA binding domain, AbrB family n=1 Tax=Methanomethylovorans hollandica (strain DSM 15978 / NBRC 107637 / DMS1) TaxID=867904 RepID=L0KU37_METHD|nr:AbrB/MazE/SpoVT family DNA-binding domain-containing protein [Methanomethylovorans hollandica]AGB48932.1 looped-hinge helix DNA binding domain, AbrB family [Methanomethylovorans hollandica DSM 15978]